MRAGEDAERLTVKEIAQIYRWQIDSRAHNAVGISQAANPPCAKNPLSLSALVFARIFSFSRLRRRLSDYNSLSGKQEPFTAFLRVPLKRVIVGRAAVARRNLIPRTLTPKMSASPTASELIDS